MVYAVVCEGCTVFDPERKTAPMPWSIAQEMVFAVDQTSSVFSPREIKDGTALKVISEGGGPTWTVTVSAAVPPGPAHASVYVLEEVRFPVGSEPSRGRAPDHAPEAVQESASCALHERTADVS